MAPKISVIYYSSTGNLHKLAVALAKGAEECGAETRVRRVEELAPPEAMAYNPKWQEHHDWAIENVEEVTLDDLAWADGFATGSPTRFGLPAAQLKQFLDQTGGLWAKGAFLDKVGTSFTSASTDNGGLETTIVAMNNLLYHLGCIVVSLGYSVPPISAGNPYGASWVSHKSAPPDEYALAAAEQQGRRLAVVAEAVAASGLLERAVSEGSGS